MTVEAVRVLLEAMRVIIEAVRKIIEAVRLIVETMRLLVEAGRVLRSSANNSIPIDPRLRNNFLHSLFDPVKFRAIVLFVYCSRCYIFYGLPALTTTAKI